MHSHQFHIHRGDAIDWLSGLPDQSVDLIVTDPPYESLEKHRSVGTTTRLSHSKSSSNDWFQIFPNSRFRDLLPEIWRVLKPNRHFYLFCDAETMFVVKPVAESAGFKFWKPLVWNKVTMGMGYHYRAQYEFILFFEKGKRRLNDLAITDILEAPRIRGGYPAEKPVTLLQTLITQSSDPGFVIGDPFMGSAAVGVAALKLNRRFWGNDLSLAAMQVAQERLERAAHDKDADAATASR